MTALTVPDREGSAATRPTEGSRNTFISIQKSHRKVTGDITEKQNAPKENGIERGEP